MKDRIICVILKIHPEDAKYKRHRLGFGSIGWFKKNKNTEKGFVSGNFKHLFERNAFDHYFYAVKVLRLL